MMIFSENSLYLREGVVTAVCVCVYDVDYILKKLHTVYFVHIFRLNLKRGGEMGFLELSEDFFLFSQCLGK